MAISIKAIGNQSVFSLQDILKVVKDVFSDLEDQLNDRGQVYVSITGTVPSGLTSGDVIILDNKGRISLLVKTKKSFDTLTAEMLGGLSKQGTQYLGHLNGTVNPTIATNFPHEEDWGFYTNSTTPATFLCLNVNGVLKKVTLT